MLTFLSFADTEVLACARAPLPEGFPAVRAVNPVSDPRTVEEIAEGSAVVVARLLGGRVAWADGVASLRSWCVARSVPLVLLGGEAEPDAELAELSTAPAGVVAHCFEYLRHGGVANTAAMLRFLGDTLLLRGDGFDEPQALAEWGGDPLPDGSDVPVVGIVYYRAHFASGNTEWVDVLADAVRDAGGEPVRIWTSSLRGERADLFAALSGRVDALVTTVLSSGEDATRFDELGVPVIQALCVTTSRAVWEQSDAGLRPLDAAMQVAIPEFDGRIIGGPVSFKEPADGVDALVYRADPERCARLARLAVRHASLRRLDAPRVAIVLSSFPTQHGRIGNAVGLDTPASALALLSALGVSHPYGDGDELIHALIAAGGFDPEWVGDEGSSLAPGRLPVADYERWFSSLDAELRDPIVATWGPAPGERFVAEDGIVIGGLDLGRVYVAIQPPRGYGDDPVAVYHDPELPAAHHYLATYRWLDEVWGADAIVHLGKHGTLEWLPGKALAPSAACTPNACLGDVPLFYPFVVNDPGEGVQAKRRAHAVMIDHLVPPMARAETYDELAQLEQLLDEFARCEVLDPPKLPALAAKIWTLLHEAKLDVDLGLGGEQPELEEFGALIEHVDGYLCELGDLQVRDGLHVLGQAPAGDALVSMLAAVARLGEGAVLGLRRAIGVAFGVDEHALLDAPGARVDAPAALVARFPGPAARASDVLERLEDAQRVLLSALAARDFAFAPLAASVLGVDAPDADRTLEWLATQAVPRLASTTDEIGNLLGGLAGRHVPPGPSGSPTRGRLDVLPTGRNFHGVDPRAIPSELACETGARLADALIAAQDDVPETVGLVLWGTAAMRTHGDDAGEVLALLGVRPTWNRETRRISGLEVIPLEELGRPRIDVAMRISGFFRDAFPHLVQVLDDAVVLVAGLDEPAESNFVRKHAIEEAARLSDEFGADAAWRRATARVFGSKPGAYGTGILQLVDVKNWRDDADLAAVYEAWGGHAYGRGLDGGEAREQMRSLFARIEVAVKNVDTREHDILDSSDYFAEHGGMVAYVRHVSGREPAAAIGDSSDPSRVRSRTLADESRRIFRARVANPRWIAAMVRHGYKGAFELSATVDYLFGYDATTGVVEDWMYETLSDKYVRDPDVAEFMRKSNPWALRAIAERLLEAADRGLWAEPAEGTLDALREAYLATEDDLEGATA